ncbi:MAG: protoporphyrinogen oxidase, partial [Caldilineaceae bacterium]|nr:protoporphyrinogen oxidase [Caldilineaceae bacterium]
MTQVVILGGGLTGLAAAYRLQKLMPSVAITLVERDQRFGGKVITEQIDGFVIEGAADSFLSRKPRGVGLCEELGLAPTLYGRDPRHAKTFVKYAGELYPLPAGLSGMIPTNLDALADNPLISPAGKQRLAEEMTLPAAPPNGDESVGSFVSRRLGREVYEKLVEPLMSGIYAGNGDLLSLGATFPQLRQLELNHGSLLKGLTNPDSPPAPSATTYPPFVSLPGGMGTLIQTLVAALANATLITGVGATQVGLHVAGKERTYTVTLADGRILAADALILTTPAFVTATLVADLDPVLADAHAAIPYASSAIVHLAYDRAQVSVNAGYGYVIPRVAHTDVLACTWSSNKWQGRAPADALLLRVYLGRYGQRDVTQCTDAELIAMAQQEVQETQGITATPRLQRVYRWPRSMPQ